MAKPLRNPGDSTHQRLQDLLFDRIMPWLMAATLAVITAGNEWVRSTTDSPPNPTLFTFLALAVIAFTAYRCLSSLPQIRQLKQGRDGEMAVGQFLERLRQQGAQVFHDFPGDDFNIDHIIIHTSGIYAVETKTFSKPVTGNPTVSFDGHTLLVAGWKPDRDPLVQARASARWLSEKVNESTGRKWNVTPMLLFPGWFVDPPPKGTRSDVFVLNPKALPNFIGNARTLLKPEEVSMVSFHLSRFARAT